MTAIEMSKKCIEFVGSMRSHLITANPM